jgi:hypothetical protein
VGSLLRTRTGVLPEHEVTLLVAAHTFVAEGEGECSLGLEVSIEVAELASELTPLDSPELEVFLSS